MSYIIGLYTGQVFNPRAKRYFYQDLWESDKCNSHIGCDTAPPTIITLNHFLLLFSHDNNGCHFCTNKNYYIMIREN